MVESRNVAKEHDAGSSSTNNPRGPKRARATSSPNGDTPAKRSRVSRACDQCRASREKCDGVKPQCHTCESQKRACTYNEPPKKRGIQPNYIRTLELTLAWIFRAIPNAQTSLSEALPGPNGPAQRLIGGKDAAGAEALHQVWRTSLVCKQIDQLLSGAVVEGGQIDAIDPRLSRAVSDAEARPDTPLLSTQSGPATQAISGATQTNGRQQSTSTAARPITPNTEAGRIVYPSGDGTSSVKLKLPQNSWTLLEYYFAFTQSWLPMTEKHNVLRTMYAYPADGLSPKETSSTGDHAELWSILSLASFQMSHKSTGNIDYLAYRTSARSLIPSSHGDDGGVGPMGAFEKGHIRALLVLSLLGISNQSWQSAWLEVGLAARLILHIYAQADRNTGDRADRPVLHLATFIVENTIARHLGLVPHMRTESIQGFDSLDEDGLEEWAPWTDPTSPISGVAKAPSKAFSTFNALVHELRVADYDFSTPGKSEHHPQTVLALLDNACKKEHREQPSKLAAGIRSPEVNTASQPAALSTETHAGAGSLPPNAGPNQTNRFPDPLAQLYQQDQGQAGYLSIPTGPTDLNFPQGQAQAAAGPSYMGGMGWPGYDTRLEGASSGQDIFEELAMLDSVEPMGQDPQFMQNLGFGPDLDLAEFFGSDYQPSNPLLAYMQPQNGGKPGGDFG